MKLILITSNPQQCEVFVQAGVDCIMVDLEINGKVDRQGHLNTVISRHTLEDIRVIRSVINQVHSAELMVRINPLYSQSEYEINQALSLGADRIMLPMFTHQDEVTRCIDLIAGRAPLTLLLETSAAFARLPSILKLKGFDDIHIGLNDLHLDMGLDFMFELFSSGLLDHAASLIRSAGFYFGIGGVSSLGTGMLPAELILAAHKDLGSKRVILSRTFLDAVEQGRCISDEIQKIRLYMARDDMNLSHLRGELDLRTQQIVCQIRKRAT